MDRSGIIGVESAEMQAIIKASPLETQLRVAVSAAKLKALELKCSQLKACAWM